MKIFIDSANIEEIKKYVSWGLCDGVTTNPTICLKDGISNGEMGLKERIREIAKLISPLLVSIEVTSEEESEIIKQAKEYNQLAENIAVKVTITDRNGKSLLPVVSQLIRDGIRINVTAMTTFNQLILAAKCINSAMQQNPSKKPHFISVFAGRISEEHGLEIAFQVIKDIREWLDFYKIKDIEIIVGSVRSPENVNHWSKAGAHILTVTPQIIEKCVLSARTKETVAQFIEDAKKLAK